MKKHNFGNKKHFILFAFVALFLAIGNGLLLLNIGKFTDASLARNWPLMLSLLKTMTIVFAFITLFEFLTNYISKKHLEESMVDLKVDYMENVLKRTPIFLSKAKSSQFVSNLTSDADRLELQYYMEIQEIIHTIFQFIISCILLTSISTYFIPVILLLAFIFISISSKTGETIKKDESKKSKSLVKFTAFIEETLNGFEVIKQHKLQDSRLDTFDSITEQLKKDQFQVEKQTTLMDGLNSFVQVLILIGASTLGVIVALKTNLNMGGLMVIISSFSNIIWPLRSISPQIISVSSIKVIFEDYDKTLKEEMPVTPLTIDSFENISFNNVDLGYDKTILSNVNFSINRNEKVLIVGPSGEGKSTLLKSILRELDPLDGEITTNNKKINQIEIKPYFDMFSLVHQKGFIFSNTVENNINLLGKEDTQSHLDAVSLSTLDKDLDLQNDGSNISGGQRARLMLARANFFNKEVVLTDEVFASLDQSIGESLEKDMLSLPQTLINISHIVFKNNLDLYDKFLIVENGCVQVSYNKDDVIARMLETDVVIT